MAYLKAYQARMQLTTIVPHKAGLQTFSAPQTTGVAKHVDGYDNRSISDDLITDLYLMFSRETRQRESEDSLRVKGGEYLRPQSYSHGASAGAQRPLTPWLVFGGL